MELLLDPNVAYLLLVGGFVLSILALFSPGTGLLELGALFALLLAGYSIYNLPVNAWALGLLVVGVIPFLLALKRWQNWVYLIVSMAALVAGSVFLFRGSEGRLAVHPALAVIVSLLSVGFMWLIGRKGLEAVTQRTVTLERLVGMTGEARTPIHDEGTVYVGGEAWTARSKTFVPEGSTVRVIGREGLSLMVELVPAPQPSVEP